MRTLITLEVELFVACQSDLMRLYSPIVRIQKTLDFRRIGKAGKAPLPAVLAVLFSTKAASRAVWTPGRILWIGHIWQSWRESVRTLITLEIELFVRCQSDLMRLYSTIVRIQKTLDFRRIGKAGQAAIPAVLALLFPTKLLTRTVWTPTWKLGICHTC